MRHLTHLLTTAASDGTASPGDRGQKAWKGQERGKRAGLHRSRVGGWGADNNLASKKSPKYGIKMTATRKHWRPAEGNDVRLAPHPLWYPKASCRGVDAGAGACRHRPLC